MYACFLLVGKEWKLYDTVQTSEEVDYFKEIARDMMNKRMLGKPILGYAAHELVNLADKAVQDAG